MLIIILIFNIKVNYFLMHLIFHVNVLTKLISIYIYDFDFIFFFLN